MRTAAILAVATLALGAMLWAADDAVIAPQQDATTIAPVTKSVVSSTDAITVPQVLSYQGRLTDASGVPVHDGNYSVVFKLYTVPTGGSPFWGETQNLTTRDGLFSALLGSVTPIGPTPNAGEAYLGMAVAGDVEMTPRLRIAGAAQASTTERTANAGLTTWSPFGIGDSDWVRAATPDSVLYTWHQLGIAKGVASNMLYGTACQTHVNLGVACTTGTGGVTQSYITVGGGYRNRASKDYATVSGGYRNTVSGSYANTSGGSGNTASGSYSTAGGGANNRASGNYAAVSGGYINTASGTYATVNGGMDDTAKAVYGGALSGYSNLAGDAAADTGACVAGGFNNSATGKFAFGGGGQDNHADSVFASVVGGANNRATGRYTFVGGGSGNTASGNDCAAVVSGVYNTASGLGSFLGGGGYNTAGGNYGAIGGGLSNNTIANSATVGGGEYDTARAYFSGVLSGRINLAGDEAADSGAVVAGGGHNKATSMWSFIGGGSNNVACGDAATVAGGASNTAGDNYYTGNAYGATVGGGVSNRAGGYLATVGGGQYNGAEEYAATVSGGYRNKAYDEGATVAGGVGNTAGNWYGYGSSSATVGGGDGNVATGVEATVPGGGGNIAAGEASFAVGGGSEVPADYYNSAAFNGQVSDDDYEVRCDVLHSNSMAYALDDPLDPVGTIMNQFAVGSPEIVVTFRGSAVIGTDGRVVAELPRYFDALCRNPMVQLTGVETYEVYVADKVVGNQFVIGGKPGTEVYWTVTGERKDQLAEITRIRMPVQKRRTGALVGRSISDANLAGALPELQRLGLDGRYSFRTAAGRQRYEDMLKRKSEAKQRKSAQPIHPRVEPKQIQPPSQPQKLQQQ